MKKFNEFNKVFSLLMEQIESGDLFDKIKNCFSSNFNDSRAPLSDDFANDLIAKALEYSKEDFSKPEDVNEVWVVTGNYPCKLEWVTIISVNGDTVKFKFKTGPRYRDTGLKPDTEIEMKIGEIISNRAVREISEKTNAEKKRIYDKQVQDKKDLDASRAEQAKNAENVPGFKDFLKEIDKKKSGTGQMPEDFDEMFKNQTKEVKEAYIAYISAKSANDPNLMYADGDDYYQTLERDRDAEKDKEKLIKHLESML